MLNRGVTEIHVDDDGDAGPRKLRSELEETRKNIESRRRILADRAVMARAPDGGARIQGTLADLQGRERELLEELERAAAR